MIRFTRVMICMAVSLAIAGCDGGAPQEAATNIQVPEGDYQARLQAMPEGERNAVFIRALRDAGRDCQGVVSSAFQGATEGNPTWTARCNDGTDWVILIGRDGIAEVASAPEAEQAGISETRNSQ